MSGPRSHSQQGSREVQNKLCCCGMQRQFQRHYSGSLRQFDLWVHVELLGSIVIGGLKSALYGSLAAPKYMQTLCSGSRQHSAAANSALCSGSQAVFSGSLPYAVALLQHSQTRHSGNLTMQRQLGGNHVQLMFGSVVLSRGISAAIEFGSRHCHD
ncbi:hypothetical protein DFH08DRAFT_824893 [Mycena albidolilacea]|uniref:Uncharacterized protein n=1 Tax=Mycena albidolilacea TaxID=1033008 RepID=A0AAD6Z2Y8_9AGAR|nr:hypothetical protein DFH08DRAFT_824893 [Mycena albidolilacea]